MLKYRNYIISGGAWQLWLLFADEAAIRSLHSNALRRLLAAIKFTGLVGLQHTGIGSGGGSPIDRLYGITSGYEARCGAHQIIDFVSRRHFCAGFVVSTWSSYHSWVAFTIERAL